MNISPSPLIDFNDLDQRLHNHENNIDLFRKALSSASQALKERFTMGASSAELVICRAETVDQLLQRAWQLYFSDESLTIALVAVGGYGRGELHPGSDIDLLLLLQDQFPESNRENIEGFLTFLWDIGLEVGHSVRTVDECVNESEQDITVATNLLEARLLTGPKALFDAMQAATGPEHIWPVDRFFVAKCAEQEARHHKYHDTAYNLEPNVKESPGGLRDIQTIGWVTKRKFGAQTLHELLAHKFLNEEEYATLINGQNFLWRIRFALHTITGRREDRLLFDYQRTLAQMFGYSDTEHNLAVEQFMQRYYRTVMELGRLNEMLLQLFEEAILYANDTSQPTPINKRFQARRGFIELVNEKILERYPFALLEVFLLLQQHPELKGIRASTIRYLRDHCFQIDDSFRADIRARSLFIEIFRQPRGITHELRRMNRYGVLAAYLPVFARIVGRMQYDLFHEYTVDEHTLFVIRNLRRIALPHHKQELPYCHQVFQAIPKPELLYLSAIFHDIAKGRGGDHSELGSKDAYDFCIQHGLSEYDSALVAWLVKNHLLMSMTAQRKDISDPYVIHEFAKVVDTPTRLNYLYLLTVADIRATNVNLWNSWKDALLKQLYGATKRVLRKGLLTPEEIKRSIQYKQTQARALLTHKPLHPMEDADVDRVWENFSQSYFTHHNTNEIAWHTQEVSITDIANLPLVLARTERERGSTSIFIYGPVEDHQFALSTLVLERLGLNVVDARIFTSKNKYTLDSFHVLEENGSIINTERRLLEIQRTLKKNLDNPETYPMTISIRQPRQHKHFDLRTQVTFEQDEKTGRTIVEVSTADRPGVLSRIGLSFINCQIRLHGAQVATIGARAEDLFFITSMDNEPVTDVRRMEELRTHIIKMLEQ